MNATLPIETADEVFDRLIGDGIQPRPRDENAAVEAARSLSDIFAGDGKEPKKRTDPRDHYPRTYKLLNGESKAGIGQGGLYPGGFFWRADYTQTTYSGQIVRCDLLGLADIAGLTADGRSVFVQVTSVAAMGAHLREYTDDAKEIMPGLKNPHRNLRAFLERGGEFLLVGWQQPEGKKIWEPKVTPVTPELLDLYVSRKRGKK